MDTLPREEIRLGLVADAFRRRWPLILVTGVIIGAAGVVVAAGLPVSYSSTADILLNPTPGNALTTDSARSGEQINVAMQTEAGLVKSPPVAELVSKTVGETVEAANDDVAVTIPPNTQIVRIQSTGATPQKAQKYTAAYADAVLAYRGEQSKGNVTGQLDLLKKQSETATTGLAKAAKAASGAVPPADALAQVQLYTNRLATLQDEIGSLEVSAVAPGTVITPASLPSGRDGIPPALIAAVIIFLGLIVGVVLAIWRERADDRLRAKTDGAVESVPVMGVVPAGLGGERTRLINANDDGAMADAYRGVRAATFATASSGAVIAVAALDESLDPASHRVAVNLAASIAVTHHRVCLVDATLGDGAISRLAGISAERGLADLLREEVDVVPTVEAAAGFSVVPGGSTALTARELLASESFRHVVQDLADRYDYVILAAPPASLSEGSEVALAATGMIVVAAERRSERAALRRLVRRAGQLGISVIGLVAVDYRRGEHERTTPSEPLPVGPPRQKPAVTDTKTRAAG